MDRAHLGEPPKDVHEVSRLEPLAGSGHDDDERLARVATLAHHEVAQVPRPAGLVVRLELLLAGPVANGETDRVSEIGGQEALLDPDDLVPTSRAMESEIDAVFGRRERVLELVAIAELGCGGHDRLERRLGKASDANERITNLARLLRELRVVREILEATSAADPEVPTRSRDPGCARNRQVGDDTLGEAALHLRDARTNGVAR